MLTKAREEAAQATGAALERPTRQIDSFEPKLDEARKKKEQRSRRRNLQSPGSST